MTDFSDFITVVKDWANRQDWSDALVTAFTRDAEQYLNSQLRVDRQLRVAANTIGDRCSGLPDDWLEMELVELANVCGANGYLPIRYKSQDEFFNLTDANATNKYTIKGRTLFVGGAPDATEGTAIRITYYAEVPAFSDAQDSWVYTKFPSLLRYASLMHSDLYAVGEEEKAIGLKQLVDDMIQKLNDAHLKSKASGSRLTRTRTRRLV